MGRINSRSKGMKGEKMAIEFMKKWTGMDFKRTPGSGGLRGHVVDYTEGDIVCVKKNYIFPICLEVKFYKELNFSHLLYDSRTNKARKTDRGIEGFWNQAKASARRAEKIPLLLMRYNGLPANFFFVIMGKRLKSALAKDFDNYFLYNNRFYITTTTELIKLDWTWVDKVSKKLINI